MLPLGQTSTKAAQALRQAGFWKQAEHSVPVGGHINTPHGVYTCIHACLYLSSYFFVYFFIHMYIYIYVYFYIKRRYTKPCWAKVNSTPVPPKQDQVGPAKQHLHRRAHQVPRQVRGPWPIDTYISTYIPQYVNTYMYVRISLYKHIST